MNRKIYLDYAAATPIRPEVVEVMSQAQKTWQNPSSVYLSARDAQNAIHYHRETVAKIAGVKPGSIIFTAGATESVNLAIGGVMRRFPKGRLAVAGGEHKAVMAAAKGYAKDRVDIIKLDKTGLVTKDNLLRAVKPSTVLVSVGYASSETGRIQPLSQIARWLKTASNRTADRPLYLHSDASAAAGYLPLKINRLGVDLLSLGSAKLYGPKSSGFLVKRPGVELEPLVYGGGQEQGLRAGTEDLPGLAGLATALEMAQAEAPEESARLHGLRAGLQTKLSEHNPAIEWITPNNKGLPHIAVGLMPVRDAERLVMELDEAGLMAATGAACSANFDEPSPALLALGLSADEANRSLRLSLGRQTTPKEIQQAVKIITAVLQK